MTVALFVEAVDTIRALGWALVVWIVLLAAVAGVALYAVVVAVACACRAVWRGAAAVWARMPFPAPRRCDRRPQTRSGPLGATRAVSGPPAAVQSRATHPAPSWAQPDKEAA